MPVTEERIAANHLGWFGHLPEWVPSGNKTPLDVKEHCAVCGITRGFRPSWTVHPHWTKGRR